MAVKFSQFNLGTASATAYVVGYDGSSNVKIPATALTPSGTPGVLPKYASPSGLANSLISDDGSYVTVGGFLIATNDATINGLAAGRGNGAFSDNVAFGVSALSSNISGSASVSIGGYSLSSNSTGNSNVAVGAYAMQLSGQANNNVAIGQSALNGLTGISGNTDNVAIGYQAMRSKTGALGAANVAVGALALADGGGTGGSNNVAIGTQALRNLTSGIRNVAVGYQAQRFNLTATGNVGVGWQSLYNATGNTNVAIGFLSGYLITTGANNVVIGGNSGSSIATLSNFMIFSDGAGNERFRIPSTGNVLINTTTDAGYRLDVSGTFRSTLDANINGLTVGKGLASVSQNTAFGVTALASNTTGNAVTAIGYQAGNANTTSSHNTYIGNQSGRVSTGANNTFIGSGSGQANIGGAQNTFLGTFAGYDVTTGTYNTLVGYNVGRGLTTGNYNTIIGGDVTGLSASLSNTIILADGQGNQRLYINSSGNVGIGTTSPGGISAASVKLDVRGTTWFSADAYGQLEIIPTIGNGGETVIRQYTTSPRNGGDLRIRVDASIQGGNFIIATGANNERMRVNASGNVLIGTATDSGFKLDVSGSTRLNGTLRIDGQRSATAGGASGQHLIVNCDGTAYKIALLNP